MKRQINSSSPPSSPFSNSELSDEFEPVPKRPRIFVSSPTPPPEFIDDNDQIDDDEEEIVIDEPIVPSVIIAEESLIEEDDDDIIEIEQQNDDAVIIVSDSDTDDDQGIDVTDDIIPSVSSIIHESIFSPNSTDVEIVHEELTLMDDDDDDDEAEEQQQQRISDEDNEESLDVTSDNNDSNELIDLTDDEPNPINITTSVLPERKLSTDVQQCPICLETLSHLQRTGVYLIITPCRHIMCTLCSRQLLATSSRCPLCRENMNSATLMPYCILT